MKCVDGLISKRRMEDGHQDLRLRDESKEGGDLVRAEGQQKR